MRLSLDCVKPGQVGDYSIYSLGKKRIAQAIHARGGIYVWLHQRSNNLAESVALAHRKFLALLAERRAAAARIPQ